MRTRRTLPTKKPSKHQETIHQFTTAPFRILPEFHVTAATVASVVDPQPAVGACSGPRHGRCGRCLCCGVKCSFRAEVAEEEEMPEDDVEPDVNFEGPTRKYVPPEGKLT